MSDADDVAIVSEDRSTDDIKRDNDIIKSVVLNIHLKRLKGAIKDIYRFWEAAHPDENVVSYLAKKMRWSPAAVDTLLDCPLADPPSLLNVSRVCYYLGTELDIVFWIDRKDWPVEHGQGEEKEAETQEAQTEGLRTILTREQEDLDQYYRDNIRGGRSGRNSPTPIAEGAVEEAEEITTRFQRYGDR